MKPEEIEALAQAVRHAAYLLRQADYVDLPQDLDKAATELIAYAAQQRQRERNVEILRKWLDDSLEQPADGKYIETRTSDTTGE